MLCHKMARNLNVKIKQKKKIKATKEIKINHFFF